MSSSPRYVSTRGAGAPVSFEDALLKGLAPDGGLYVPEEIVAIPPDLWRQASDFPSMGVAVLQRWLAGQLNDGAVESVVRDALNFPVPLVRLQGGGWDDVFVLELFHGPTLSFKDFGARTMARFMGHFLDRRDDRLTILVATSGDTGSAVADGFSGQQRVQVGLLYPKGQVSPVQERQLIVKRPGVRSFAVRGTFDDCQRMVKEAFMDPGLTHLRLSSANSINIGRLLPQMLYYFESFRIGPFADAVVCVPSGNLGNLTAGVMASLSGLPVRRFIAAHNANDFFPGHLQTGSTTYRPSVRTLSSAMDVGVPSNFERLRHFLPLEIMRDRISATSVTDEDTRRTIREVYDQTGYLADPHTAVGLRAVQRFREAGGGRGPVVVASTAHPAKFPEIVEPVVGFDVPMPEALRVLWDRETFVLEVEPEVKALAAALGA
ncbi:MAG TPA: threonine synthase [Rhodothermales bacterium]